MLQRQQILNSNLAHWSRRWYNFHSWALAKWDKRLRQMCTFGYPVCKEGSLILVFFNWQAQWINKYLLIYCKGASRLWRVTATGNVHVFTKSRTKMGSIIFFSVQTIPWVHELQTKVACKRGEKHILHPHIYIHIYIYMYIYT